MTQRKRLAEIKKKWEWYFKYEDRIITTNMLWQMAGNYQNCHDLIWLIKTLEKKLPSRRRG